MSPTSSFAEPSSGWRWIQIWLVVCVGCNALGWFLAGFGLLGRSAYAVAGILLVLFLGVAWSKGWLRIRSFHRRRWRRALPRVFALVLITSFLGGLIHPPNNYDALTYRIPQMLHWMTAGRWHWVSTAEVHMNFSCAGQGWLFAPWLAWFQSDRPFFLSNIVALAVLPGMFFSLLRRCGVASRVAWSWMWLLPSASCYALQSGSLGNDLLATAYWCTALAFGLRARQTGQPRSLWFAVLAAALATGVKLGVAPLALPWLLVIFPCWKVAVRTPVSALLLGLLALCISAAPTAVQNVRYTGHFSGDPHNQLKLQALNPAAGLIGNVIEIAVGAFAPPVFPGAAAANQQLTNLENSPLGLWLRQGFPRFDPEWSDLSTEESAGFGLGLTALALAGLVIRGKRWSGAPRSQIQAARAVTIGTAVALLYFLVKVAGEGDARLIAPFYPLLLLPILRRFPVAWLRRPSWHWLSLAAGLSIWPALILTPARPLFPAVALTEWVAQRNPSSRGAQRVALVYSTYAQRHDYVRPLKAFIPPGTTRIGFIPTENDIEATYWKPYGSWEVVEIRKADPADPLVASLRGSVILTSRRALQETFSLTPEAFATTIRGRLLASRMLSQKARFGPEEFFIFALE